MEQVAVRGVQLDALEAGINRPPRCLLECGDDGLNLSRAHLLRRLHLIVREGARRDGARHARFAPRVRELDHRRRPMLGHERNDRPQRHRLLCIPQPKIARADPSARLDRGRLDDDEARPAHRPTAQVRQVPVRRHTVLLKDGVLAHGRNPDAVARGHAAQGDRREQVNTFSGHAVSPGPVGGRFAAIPAHPRRRLRVATVRDGA